MQVKVVEPLVKKRCLKKVRRHFLHKTPSSNTTEVVILPQHVCEKAFQMIDPSIGLVVKNRKICAGIRFLNSHFTINDIRVEDHFNSKAVSFNIEPNQNNPIVPLEYHAKRLESYGNLDLAAWAQKIKDYQTTYPKVMNRYFELARSEDPNVIAGLAKASRQAVEAQRLIQSSYAYKSVRLFSNGTRTVPLVVTYSEKILKEMGHNLESFCASVKESGIPTLFSGDSAYHIEMAKSFLSCSRLRVHPVQYGSEFKSYLYDRTGTKRPAVLQSISFVEPAPGGLFLTGCLIIKSMGDQAKNSQAELLCDFPPKCVKEKSTLEEIISTQEL